MTHCKLIEDQVPPICTTLTTGSYIKTLAQVSRTRQLIRILMQLITNKWIHKWANLSTNQNFNVTYYQHMNPLQSRECLTVPKKWRLQQNKTFTIQVKKKTYSLCPCYFMCNVDLKIKIHVVVFQTFYMNWIFSNVHHTHAMIINVCQVSCMLHQLLRFLYKCSWVYRVQTYNTLSVSQAGTNNK